MSACNTFTEHVWKPGECKNCFKPKSLHQLPPVSEKKPLSHANLKANASQSGGQRPGRGSGSFRPPVAKKPTIAVKPTMMVAEGLCGELATLEQVENKPLPAGWNRNKEVLSKKPLNNNNEEEIEGYSHVPRPYGSSEGVGKVPNNNNNNGLTEVLKEIAGLDTTPQLAGNETNARETFLGRINSCYKRSLERKIPPSCMVGGMKDSQSKHVILSGSTEVISNEGGRFCYPELSSGDESEDDTFFGSMQEEHESWDESDEELLAMEIRMRGQPRFANFRANTLSPVPFCVDKKWNTVPLRNKSLQRICAVDYDDSYDEILNGYGEETVILYGQESMQSMASSDSTSPDSSLTEESRSGTTSSSSQKLCNGGLSPSTPQELKVIEPEYESLCDNQQVKDVPKAPRTALKSQETHKAVLALRLEEKDGKIAVQTDMQENKSSSDVAGQAVTINLVPVEEQAKPYRVVNMEQPVCKPYTVVDVSAAMTSECKENQTETSETKKASSNPSSPVTPGTPIASSAASPVRVHTNLKKSSAIRYQEVWTSSTSPRQKIPKVELIGNGSGPSVPPRKTSHKSAPTSPTATNVSSKTIPVKSPNLSEIKFNSYNNAGMPPFPIIIHDEPTYAKSSKNAIKVPIVINPNAYDNLAIYKSFLGTTGELKADDEEEREKDREKGKLVGLDGTVIHMLPPPPVQRHHWFSEAKSESSEKPSIVFMYRCDPAQTEPRAELPAQPGLDSAIAEALAKDKGETQEKPPESSEQSTASHSSPPQAPKKIPSTPEHCGINGSPEFQDMIKRLKKALKEFPLMGNCVSEYSGQVPEEPALEELSPRVPRAVFVKQDNGGSASVIPASRGAPGPEEKEAAPNSPDLSTCSATYSNLGDLCQPQVTAETLHMHHQCYLTKICKSKAKESQQYYHSLSIRQSLAINFNIQQDCGHFLAEVPMRLLPWEDDDAADVEEEREEEEKEAEQKNKDSACSPEGSCRDSPSRQGTLSKPRSRVVVITREVPQLTVADFVRDSAARHSKSPDLYERQVCLLLLQLCLGLEHLKPYHITHCDLRLENLLLVHSRPGGSPLSPEATEPNANTACPARLIVSNFSQAKQKSHMVDPEVLRDQSRLAPEIITATQYKKCDEFQTGILIYEMLHLPNPFDENPELKEKEYTCADLPKIPCRSLYSQGLQQLASCLLNPNPSERILISEAKGILQCLLWGPREDLFHALSTSSNPSRRDAILQNWLDIKRTLLMIKFAEKSLERDCGIILEDWLCCQYLAFATTDSLHRIVRLMKQH
ncbi:hypothetical protein EK904_007846 [Melospiza melodia maxima]|nr:hypothetical protein EK904_007846 [Melospiza melodia maxima]